MEKIITLIMAAVMGCTGFCGSSQPTQLAENEMRVSIINETEDSVSGFGMDYVIDGSMVGGSGAMNADGTMDKGEEIDLDLNLDRFDLEEKESFDFAMSLNVFLEDNTTAPVESFAQWNAQPQGDYEFVVSGSQKEGYELTVKEADFDCTITPLTNLGENEMRVSFINETDDSVAGFGMDYTIEGVRDGGSGGSVAGGTMEKGDEINLDLMLDGTALKPGESFTFGMGVEVYLEDGTTVYVPFYAKWNAQLQNEYRFVVSGSQAEGYIIACPDADFNGTITPAVG